MFEIDFITKNAKTEPNPYDINFLWNFSKFLSDISFYAISIPKNVAK